MSEITDKTLPPPPRPAYIEIVLGLLVSAAIFLLFTYRGNSSHAATEGTSLLRWIDWQWIPSNQDFSHGWFMLVGVLAFSDYRIQAPKSSGYGIVFNIDINWISYYFA